ncbi:radical SAM protein with 4Fe4S-binding SPASM domain [Desulfobaculum xiamenense]|uniref:Radical SAM protein with 4Fe4S-binding SPASM domain n=1 Tax=Desulfobaculum xiamenense TaxID=995050 RepID=A0A846QRQ5_9BACT|nr:radical SAM/SPASM domain-containing protein [Desulfobaculum xiamenense]NJB69202.1 radical SAM protein with 4Fe4S-binding SPASM domain [Desulfobaculum xiamenense]
MPESPHRLTSKAERDVNVCCQFLDFNETWERDMGPAFMAYRHDWQRYSAARELRPFPMHLDFDLTNTCTLRCTFCPRTQMARRGTLPPAFTMPFDVYAAAIDEGAQKGLYAVNLNASGEPLLHPDLVRMVTYARESGILDIMLHTSGLFLDEPMAQRLMDAGLTKLIVSFDSPDKAHYEALRVGSSYDRVVANIRTAARLKRQAGSITPFIRINMVLMRENAHEREAMIDMWRDVVDGMGFLEYINYYQWDEEDRYRHRVAYREDFVCEKPWQRLAVTHDGGIKFCHLDDADEVVLGNLSSMSLEEAWTGEVMTRYRELQKAGRIREIGLCSRCSTPMMPVEGD